MLFILLLNLFDKNTIISLLFIFSFALQFHASEKNITFQKIVDLGNAYTGEKMHFSLLIKNSISSNVIIMKIKSSFGCTKVSLSSNIIRAQESVLLEGALDTRNRLGKVSKSIRLYEKRNNTPHIIILNATVLSFPKEHPPFSNENIFSGTCAICHANQGENLYGQQLYLATCAMCHGIQGQGHTAHPLKSQSIKLHTKNKLIKIISEGNIQGMPQFGLNTGGPLSEIQLSSLAEYLLNPPPSGYSQRSPLQNYFTFCSSCHGTRKTGPIGPTLSVSALSTKSVNELIEIIEQGIPNSLMSSFLDKKGGFLTKDEIHQLARYLKGH